MKKRLKVMHIIWNMNDGGAQKVILNYLRDFRDDPDLEIKLYVYKERENSICNREIIDRGYNVEYLNNPSSKIRIPFLKRYFNRSIAKRAWEKAIADYNPDIVHVHLTNYLRIVMDPIESCHIPLKFDTLHSNPYRNSGKVLQIIKTAFQEKHFIPICVTGEQVEMARDHYGITDYEILHNGVDFSAIRDRGIDKKTARKELGISTSTFVVTGVGRLNKIKNFPLLIKAFERLRELHSNTLLLIAGEGPEEKRLRKLVKKHQLESAIRFLGNRDDMPIIYSATDVLAITSISESASLVLLEAQALGVRCVISDGVPAESIITNRVKRMPKGASVEAWAEALLDTDYAGEAVSCEADYEVYSVSQKLKEIYLRRWKENGSE